MFQAVHANDLAAVQASVAEGADLDARDRWGMTATDIAVDRGNYRIAHFLLSARKLRRDQQATAASPAKPLNGTSAPAAATAGTGKPRPQAAPKTPDGLAAAKLDSQPLAAGTPSASAWPADKPNPFDPSVPAPGSWLRTPDAQAQGRGAAQPRSVAQ